MLNVKNKLEDYFDQQNTIETLKLIEQYRIANELIICLSKEVFTCLKSIECDDF